MGSQTNKTMEQKLKNRKIAILATDGFEQSEFTKPRQALVEAGATVQVISPDSDTIRGWDNKNWGKEFTVEARVEDVSADDYDGLMLPGGVMNPDKLRMNKQVVDFVKEFFDQGKPVAAICHAPQLLIETGALKGRKLTSYPSIRTDLENAGAQWEDSEVVVDAGLTTSRSPDDLPAFNKKMVEEFCEGVHADQKTL
jgi:protease I